MPPAEFLAMLKALGLTQRGLAARLGVNVTTVNRWVRGRAPVPRYALAYLDMSRQNLAISNGPG